MLEALSDRELNGKLDQVIMDKIQTFQGAKLLGQGPQQQINEAGQEVIQNSATLTITKMILFNLDKLLLTVAEVQKEGQDSLPMVLIDEDQLEMLVKLLTQNEQNGELVNKIYEILLHTVEASAHSSAMVANISVLDMSKSLLQICIKHSSIYQCESAFKFLHSMVQVSEKYQNKQEIEYSLTKIMPATLRDKKKK